MGKLTIRRLVLLTLLSYIFLLFFLEIPEKQQKRSNDDEDEGDGEKTDYEEWKRKILENAARGQANS